MFERECTFFSDDIRLAANIHLPDAERDPGPLPGVVLCHGFGGIKKHVLPELAEAFSRAGYAVLRFDYRGFGESGGQQGRVVPEEQVIDIRNGVTFLGAQPEVDAARICLYGSSFGGANAVVAAACDERVRSVVSTVGIGNGERWLRSLRRHWEWCEFQEELAADRIRRVVEGESRRVSPDHIVFPDPETVAWHDRVHQEFPERMYQLPLESAERIIEYRPEDRVESISPRPLLLIHVSGDRLVPLEESLALYERAGQPKKLTVLEGLTHQQVYSGDTFNVVTGLAIDWFDDCLATP